MIHANFIVLAGCAARSDIYCRLWLSRRLVCFMQLHMKLTEVRLTFADTLSTMSIGISLQARRTRLLTFGK